MTTTGVDGLRSLSTNIKVAVGNVKPSCLSTNYTHLSPWDILAVMKKSYKEVLQRVLDLEEEQEEIRKSQEKLRVKHEQEISILRNENERLKNIIASSEDANKLLQQIESAIEREDSLNIALKTERENRETVENELKVKNKEIKQLQYNMQIANESTKRYEELTVSYGNNLSLQKRLRNFEILKSERVIVELSAIIAEIRVMLPRLNTLLFKSTPILSLPLKFSSERLLSFPVVLGHFKAYLVDQDNKFGGIKPNSIGNDESTNILSSSIQRVNFLYFVLAIEVYRNVSSEEVRSNASSIYSSYLERGASRDIGIYDYDTLISSFFDQLQQGDGNKSNADDASMTTSLRHLFDGPYAECKTYIATELIPQFLESIYFNVLITT